MNYPINNPVMSGSTDGTPITLLRQDVAKKLNNDSENDIESHYSIESIKTTTDIKELVDEINNNIKNKNKNKKEKEKNKSKNTDNDTETIPNLDSDKKNKINKKTKSNIIEDSIYDGILLLIIYLLMSQGFVKNFLGRYIKIINVNSDGVVPFIGVFTYGLIFVLVFLSIRFFIHKVSD